MLHGASGMLTAEDVAPDHPPMAGGDALADLQVPAVGCPATVTDSSTPAILL